MTKKDYDMIAACIGAFQANVKDNDIGRKAGVDDLVARLILEMSLDNPRFNEANFWGRVEYWRNAHYKT